MEYNKPVFTEIKIDKDISLVMMSGTPPNDPPSNSNSGNGGNDSNKDDAFASPFD